MSDGALEDSSAPRPRVVDAVSLTPVLRRLQMRKTLAHIGDTALSIVVFAVALASLLMPPALFLFSGLWSTVTYISGIWTLWHEVKTWRVTDILASLVAVDTSSRFAVAGVSYFAIIFSFIVLYAGLLGRRWQHIFLIPGIVLCAPSIVIFTFAATLSFSVLASHFHLASWLQYPLLGYALLDALLLAVLLLDLRPSTRHRWAVLHLRRRESISDTAEATSMPLPVVRFGPTQPVPASDPVDVITHPAAVLVSTIDVEDAVDASSVDAASVGVDAVGVDAEEAINVAAALSCREPGLLEAAESTETPAHSEAVVAAN